MTAATPGAGKDEIGARLQAHGIQPTPQRVEIASLLLSAPQHVSADQLMARIGAGGGAVSKATVYNTLGLFAERGLVRQVIVDSARVFYDSNPHPHHHFYNVDDGTLIDVGMDDVEIRDLPRPPAGTVAEGVDVIIRVRNGPATR